MLVIQRNIFFKCVLISLLGHFLYASPGNPSSLLRVGKALTPEEGRKELDQFRSTFSDLQTWKVRREKNRLGIIKGLGLDPMPKKTNLNAKRYGKVRDFGDYTVENIALESLPGLYVTGSLYKPKGFKGKLPAVMCSHGHWRENNKNGYGRFRPDMQIRCAVMAKMGALVFSYDMLGFGDSKILGWHHNYEKALKIQTWNSIRLLDYLLERKDVDPERIAITGASGGGSQSFILAALDQRVTLSMPIVMVSSHMFGGCVCESGLPIHQSTHHLTNNADIAAMTAPRPQLVISNGDDWTQYNVQTEIPYIKEVYTLYDKSHRLKHIHLPEEKHDYGPSKREGAYRFLSQQFNLNLERVVKNGKIDESFVEIEPLEDLLVFWKMKEGTPLRRLPPNQDPF